MPKATVTKSVQQLEQHLRTRLLSRTTRRLAVTADGAAYYERALRLLADLEELDSSVAVSNVRPKGRLRIDLSTPLAQLVLIPALPAFFARYPEIQLEMGLSDRRTDLIAENVDCVIRGGDVTDQSLIARRIADMHMVTCAAPSYLKANGVPGEPGDLEGDHHVVSYFNASTGRPRPMTFARDDARIEIVGRYRIAVNEMSTYVTAALAGHGVVQVPLFLGRPHIEAGALDPILLEWSVPSVPLYVVYPPNRHLSNRLRVFVDWAAGLFASPRFTPLGGIITER